jgi:hypothetical protein
MILLKPEEKLNADDRHRGVAVPHDTGHRLAAQFDAAVIPFKQIGKWG